MAVLDTNFLIAVEQGEPDAVAWLRAHASSEHYVPDFVAVEYLTGHTKAKAAYEALQAAFVIVHGDAAWIEATVRLRKRLRKRRVRFRTPDFWVAAWANFLATDVLTQDKRHFQDLDVGVQSWVD